MPLRFRTGSLVMGVAGFLCSACVDDAVMPDGSALRPAYSVDDAGLTPMAVGTGDVAALMVALNQQFAAAGAPYAARQASLLFSPANYDPARASVVIANDRELRTGYRFVNGDARRGTVGAQLRQASFLPFMAAASGPGTAVNAKPSIDASFATWSGLQCAQLPIVNNLLPAGIFPSAILDLGGAFENPLLSDINTPGFLPGVIFDLVLGPGASTQVLGITFAFVFIDPATGEPTDIDNDGNDDAAFAEVWYNNRFRWSTTGTGPNVDIESVTLHENGHALGLGHFGKIEFNLKNGKLTVAPIAVMNAVNLGTIRKPRGSDNASFCGNWDDWH